MKLLVKFNLAFVTLLVLGIAATGFVSWNMLQRNAKVEVYENAKLLIGNALAVRGYTLVHIAPLLDTQMKYEFRPEMVSAYSALQVLQAFRQQSPEYKEYQYREPTLNPTNPADKPADWERDIIMQFRAGTAQVPFSGERDTPSGRLLYMARPLVSKGACLQCHDTAENAPRMMVAKYGSDNGFGWKEGEVIGAQVVEVPVALAQSRARAVFNTFMGSMLLILIAIGVLLNLLIWLLVIRPVTRISSLADRVSMGDFEAPEFEVSGNDEIRTLAESLSRMRKSVAQAIDMLGR